jgi:hypothetical protein
MGVFFPRAGRATGRRKQGLSPSAGKLQQARDALSVAHEIA